MKSLFQIVRVIRPAGAFGMLCFQGLPFAVSLERTFDENNRVVLPDGLSLCKRDHYIKGNYATYEIQIPGHDRVLFHTGNREVDSKACVLVAENFFDFNPAIGLQDVGIADSKGGFREFMELAEDRAEFQLFVTTVKEFQ